MPPSNNHTMADAEFAIDEVVDNHGSFECYTSKPASMTCSSSTVSCASSTVVAMDSITGKFSNIQQKYRIGSDVIGTGKHAYAVTECVDRATGRQYAVKSILKSSLAVKATDLHREVELLKEIKHDNILRLVDVREDGECLHIVTDLYGGGELYDKIVQKRKSSSAGCFAEDEAARILRQVLAAVSYLHGRGIVHRDLKPENIMFETAEEGSPIKIIDFGLSRKHYEDSFEPYMSAIVGSSYFLAPEVLRRKYDKSCDLWSVGVIAFIMLCGHPPFNGANKKEVCDAIRRGHYKFQPKYWKGVSKEAKDFIRLLLRANPGRRMTVENALNHPWITKHNTGTLKEEEPQCNSFVEIKSERLRKKDSVLSFGGIGQGKLRLSKFRF